MASDEIDSLVEKWGEDNVRKAFWLQNHIKNHGIKGIHFMHPGPEGGDSAESHMRQVGPMMAKRIIEGEMKDTY